MVFAQVEKNFQTQGRMTVEQSLLEQEMLLEQRAGSRDSQPLSWFSSQFL